MQEKLKHLHYYRWLIFGVVASGTFMATLTTSIVNVALPTITNKLNADIASAQWIVTAYLLVITSLLPLLGRLGDVYGRRRVYGSGFIGFSVGSLLCGIASSVDMLIVFRLIQAVGAAALMANAMAIVTSSFPLGERGKVLGMIGTVVALGSMSGPSIGGVLVEMISWHAIFFVNIPVGIVGFLGALLVLPVDHDLQAETIDYAGAALFAASMMSFLLALSNGTQWGWLSATTLACIGFAVVALMLFIWQETRVNHPMLDLSIFRNWTFTAGNIAGVLSFIAMFSNTILLPFYLHDVLAFSPGKIGLIMSAFPLAMAITAPVSGILSDKMGTVALTTTGLGIMSAGLLLIAKLPIDASLWVVAGGQALMGVGNGVFQSPNNSSVMGAVLPRQLGVAGGINALARNFGMVTGTAIAVSILEYRRRYVLSGIVSPTPIYEMSAFMTGYHDALIAGAIFAGLGALISLIRGKSAI